MHCTMEKILVQLNAVLWLEPACHCRCVQGMYLIKRQARLVGPNYFVDSTGAEVSTNLFFATNRRSLEQGMHNKQLHGIGLAHLFHSCMCCIPEVMFANGPSSPSPGTPP